VGILETKARLFGEFDFQSKRRFEDWSVIPELRKQYEVVKVSAGQDYPEDLDVLIAVLPNTLDQDGADRLNAYVRTGRPALILLDPLPAFNLELAPAAGRNPSNPSAPPAPQADLGPLLEALGVRFDDERIVWSDYNPHPQLRQLPEEVVFVSPGSEAEMAFQETEPMTEGLQEVVLLYTGSLEPAGDASEAFVPLMATGPNSGTVAWNRLVVRTFFGTQLATGLPHEADEESYTVAARVRREGDSPVHAVVVADADMMGEQFFDLRRRGIEGLNFDNVTLLLNAVDDLAGDEAFIALRKRRPRHRTLEAVEARTRVYEEQRQQQTEEAQATAEKRLAEAQARLDAAVESLRRRPDLDDQTREIMISNLQRTEERRLQVARANIEDARDRQIEDARISMEASVRNIQNTIKLLAVGLPPIPALVVLVIVSLRRLRLERMRISTDRLVERKTA
jgi:ABC-2 type transport system permease protein